jgi:hypothetical protein
VALLALGANRFGIEAEVRARRQLPQAFFVVLVEMTRSLINKSPFYPFF